MNEELKKFADSLQAAQTGVQIGLVTMAKTKEQLGMLSQVNNGLSGVVKIIREYLATHPE